MNVFDEKKIKVIFIDTDEGIYHIRKQGKIWGPDFLVKENHS